MTNNTRTAAQLAFAGVLLAGAARVGRGPVYPMFPTPPPGRSVRLSWGLGMLGTKEKATPARIDPLGVLKVRALVFAGDAIITLRSPKTGVRYTYRITARPDFTRIADWMKQGLNEQQAWQKASEEPPGFFGVSLLTGSNNLKDYTWIGTIRHKSDGLYRHHVKSRVGEKAPGVVAFTWFWNTQMQVPGRPINVEVWHEGRCLRCSRTLTDPVSIARGLGPICCDLV